MSRPCANDRASQLALDRLAATARSFVGLVGLENAVVRRTDGRRPVLVEPITVRGLGLDGFPGARMLLVLDVGSSSVRCTAFRRPSPGALAAPADAYARGPSGELSETREWHMHRPLRRRASDR